MIDKIFRNVRIFVNQNPKGRSSLKLFLLGFAQGIIPRNKATNITFSDNWKSYFFTSY